MKKKIIALFLALALLVLPLASCKNKNKEGDETDNSEESTTVEGGGEQKEPEGDNDEPGKDGKDGKAGLGIKNVAINGEGHLILTFDDDTTTDAGKVTADVSVPTHPHAIVEKTIVDREASCGSCGITYVVCGTCGEMIRTIVTDRLPHTYEKEFEYDASSHWHNPICGHSDAIVKEAHVFEDGVCVCGCEETPLSMFEFEKIPGADEYKVIDCDVTAGPVIIPAEYKGLPVTAIGDSVCNWYAGVTSVSIPNTVKSIGEGAFEECGITELVIPASVEEIGECAFAFDEYLESIKVEDGNENYKADGNCLVDIANKTLVLGCKNSVIPDDGSVEVIGESAFDGACGLEKITIPEGVKEIGNYAFYGTAIKSVVLPASVETIPEGGYIFCGCHDLVSIKVADGNETYKAVGNCLINIANKTLVAGCKSSVIPDDGSVEIIGEGAFCRVSDLACIDIPDSVTIIDGYAFQECDDLTDIYYGGTETQWGEVTIEATWVNDPGLVTVHYLYGFILEDSMFEKIAGKEEYCLASTVNVVSRIVIPSEYKGLPVTAIGDGAFEYEGSIVSVKIPDTVTEIGSYAFYECYNLASVKLPSSLKSIGYNAFESTNLTSVEIPASVESIGECPFCCCRNLTSLTVAEGNEYYKASGNCLIDIANKTLIQGCNASVIPNDGSVEVIGESAFYECYGLGSVTLPDGLKEIGPYAFEETGLTEIVLPEGLETIADYAFGYNDLTSLAIPSSVTSIGCSICCGNANLASITMAAGNVSYKVADNCLIDIANKTLLQGCASSVIPDDGSVEVIGDYAFDGIANLLEVTFPASVKRINTYAFYGSGLTSVTIPATVEFIEWDAFDSCVDLTEAVLECEITELSSYIFYGCTSLTSVELPASVKTIGSYAFAYCSNLETVILPATVESIGQYAFAFCPKLAEIYFGGTLAQWAAVSLGSGWLYYSVVNGYVVHCSDGDI